MSSKILIIALVIVSAFVIGLSYSLINKNPSSEVRVASYTASDKEKPEAGVVSTSFNLGKMKVSDEKSADFIVKNSGNKPLQLSNITSSCMCTAGQVILNGQASEEFGMHSDSSYVAQINPGQSATVRVIYRPFQMPVYGSVEREVYVATNDPDNPKLVFSVKAYVQ